MRLLIIFAFVTALCVLSDATPPPGNDRADIDTLKLVQIMWRHGDRTPIVMYPNDPLNDESLWHKYATGYSAITIRGKQMHYEFGKYLRQRYDGFLSPVYNQNEIYVQSSDADRAIMSAMSNMAGLWPPTPMDPKSQWNPELQWQPIPVHTIPKKLDNFINFGANCPRFNELKKEYIHDSPFAKTVNENPETVKICKHLIEHAGIKTCDFEEISDIWDTLRIQRLYNMTLPSWVDSVYDKMEKIAPIFFDSRVIVPTEEAKKVKAGPLMTFLFKNMEKKVAGKNEVSKMYALSGHDTTSSIALGALGVFDTQFPSYASAAIFELHKVNDDHIVRVFFRNSTTVPPFELDMPKCKYPCQFNKFKELVAPMMVDEEEWNKACKSGGASPSAAKSTSGASSVSLKLEYLAFFLFIAGITGINK